MRIALIAIMALLPLPLAQAKGSHSGSSSSHSHSHKGSSTHHASSKSHKSHSKNYCASCARDKHGKIKRNPAATHAFRQAHPCPSTKKITGACPGYVIDHIVPLRSNGPDDPSNMQWQTKGDAKAKDRVE